MFGVLYLNKKEITDITELKGLEHLNNLESRLQTYLGRLKKNNRYCS